MKFSIGDKVVHAHHGAGKVISVKHEELVEGFEHYYEIEIFSKELTVLVPVRKAEEVGIRPIMSSDNLTRVLDILSSKPRGLPKNFRKRQDQVWNKIKTGKVRQIAEAVRDLTWYRERAKLTRKDTDLLKRGLKFLAGEIALVSDTELAAASDKIDSVLAAAITKTTQKSQAQKELAKAG